MQKVLVSVSMCIMIVLIIYLVGCVQSPTGGSVSAPLSEYDEEKVLEQITPSFEKNKVSLQQPTTAIAVPDEYADLPKKTVKEGELVSFPNLKAVDPDGDKITYTFSPPLNEKGDWQTKKGDQGTYLITITASDGKSNVDQKLVLIVEGKNKQPTLADFEDIHVKEGEVVKIEPKAFDPDHDVLTYTYEGWINANEYKTTADDAGIHVVTVSVSDGMYKVSKDVKIYVDNENRKPKIEALDPVTINEYDKLVVQPTASDPDGDKVNIICGYPLASDCTWQTKKGDAGYYEADISASDESLSDKIILKITVLRSNIPPKITGPDEIIVIEGETVDLNNKFVITDEDGEEVQVSYTGWMTSAERTTNFDDAGRHRVTMSATDGVDVAQHILYVTVKERNRAPVFNPESLE